jgi:hypothetical protein
MFIYGYIFTQLERVFVSIHDRDKKKVYAVPNTFDGWILWRTHLYLYVELHEDYIHYKKFWSRIVYLKFRSIFISDCPVFNLNV